MKSIRTLSLLACTFFVSSLSTDAGEWKRVILKKSARATVIEIPEGKVIETTAALYEKIGYDSVEMILDFGDGVVLRRNSLLFLGQPANNIGNATAHRAAPGIVVGPATLSLRIPFDDDGVIVLQYRLLDNLPTPTALGAALLVPPKTPTPVLVRLETSTDAESWTTVVSKEIASSDVTRLYRIAATSK